MRLEQAALMQEETHKAAEEAERKEEIVQVSRKIGAFEISVLPFEDCCTVFTPKHPKTRPTLESCAEAESKLDVDALVEKAISETEYTYID